jgi:hypothetical protein
MKSTTDGHRHFPIAKRLREAEVKNIGISRRRTQTDADFFARPTWPAKTYKPSGQVGSAAPGDVLDKLRLVSHREAIAHFSSAGRGAEKPMQINAKAFSCRLRVSACVCGKKIYLTAD